MSKVENKISSFKTIRTFLKVGACSEAVMNVLDRAYEHPLELEEKASSIFAGGIMQQGYQCGMIWGAALAAGAESYRLYGTGQQAEAEAVIAAQRLVESFNNQNKNINCLEITDTDWTSKFEMFKYMITGGPIGCFRMSGRYAQLAYSELDSNFSSEHPEVSSASVSCAAMLAKKMGASEMQVVMASGLAGGIGLCGGACGALGAAVWIIGIKAIEEGVAGNNLWDSKIVKSRVDQAIDLFLQQSDHQFECEKIVGHKFASVAEHSKYVCDGGCSKIIDILAKQ